MKNRFKNIVGGKFWQMSWHALFLYPVRNSNKFSLKKNRNQQKERKSYKFTIYDQWSPAASRGTMEIPWPKITYKNRDCLDCNWGSTLLLCLSFIICHNSYCCIVSFLRSYNKSIYMYHHLWNSISIFRQYQNRPQF